MLNVTKWKRCCLCLSIVSIIIFCHLYFFVDNNRITGYVKEKLTAKQNPFLPMTKKMDPSKPTHILLLSYARTGASFVGDLLQSHPDTFYHFEPLHFISESVINQTYPEANHLLNRLFLCQSIKTPGYIEWQHSFKSYMQLNRNRKYWKDCFRERTCYYSDYLDGYCSNKSTIVIKTSRITLGGVSNMFDAFPNLNLKLVYLVRDPRATMNSRSRLSVRSWCQQDPVCADSKLFCNILKKDLDIACKLLYTQPDKFTVLRYEDISREPYFYARSLSNFFGYDLANEMDDFIKNHTVVPIFDAGDGLHYLYNTYRNSLLASTIWRQEMKFEDAFKVQENCKTVIDAFGYTAYDNANLMKNYIHLDKDLGSSLMNYCSLYN